MDARKKKVLAVLLVAAPILVWKLYALTEYLPASPAPTEAGVRHPDEAPPFLGAGEGDIERAAADSADVQSLRQAQEQIAGTPWPRNPFAPVASAQPAPDVEVRPVVEEPPDEPRPAPDIRLAGVSRSNDRWMALLSHGQMIRTGDRVEEQFIVVAIDAESVTLEAGGWLYRYQVGYETPKIERKAGNP